MNFETLKTGFRQFLVDNAKPWEKFKLEEKDNDDISIFTYADEFKNYLNKELKCDESILYQDISEILNMQIIDGKLVDPNEVSDDDADLKAKVEQGESLKEQQEVMENTPEDAEGAEGAEVSDAPVEEGAVDSQGLENYGAENDVAIEGSDVLVGVLNDLLKNEDFKSALDSSEDGDIDEEELKTFLDTIKSYDGDEGTISLQDILSAVEDVKNDMLDMKIIDEIEKEAEKEAEKASKTDSASAPAASSGGVSGGGGMGGVGGSGGMSGAGQVQEKPKYDENGNAILENMDLDDLKKELTDSQTKVGEQEKAVADAKTEKEQGIQQLEQEAQDAYNEFTEKMDAESKEKLDEAKAVVDEKQEALDTLDEQINTQDEAITTAQQAYDNADAAVNNLESSKSAYEAQKSALKTSLSKAKDGSDQASDIQAKLSAIESKIAAVDKELQAAKTKRDEAKNKLDEAQKAKDELEAKRPDLEEELSKAEEEFSKVEDEIVKNNPELKELREKYDAAKEKIQTEKANYDKKIEQAQTDLKAAQDHVREVEAAISAAEAQKDIKDNYSSNSNEEIIEFAKQFLGCNEADGSANKFLGGASSASTPWCAAFVSYVLKNNGIDTGGTWAVSGLLDWGQKNGAFVPKSNSNSNTVKPGDVVIWKENGRSHTGIVTSIAEDGTYTTIEGNTSDRVGERQYNINTDKTLTGFISINS